jgi:hypothetical protein
VTNAHEGDIFTDPAQILADSFTLKHYITELFPRMDQSQISQAVKLYENLAGNTTVPIQAAQVIGESGSDIDSSVINSNKIILDIFICPSFYVLEAFENTAWKVRLYHYLKHRPAKILFL